MSTKNFDRSVVDSTFAAMFSNSTYSQTYLFYAHMVGMCTVILTDKIKTIGVKFEHDHYVLAINPDFFNPLPLVNRLALIKHEMLHILSGHIARRKDRDQPKWNIATDCAINQFITPGHLPQGAILPSNLPVKPLTKVLPSQAAETYYDQIDKDPEDDQPQGGQPGSGQGDHTMWDESEGHPDLQTDLTRAMIERSMNQTQRSRGTLPSAISDFLALHTRSAEVDWRQVLRGITGNKRVSSRRTIMRSDRRLPGREDLFGKTKDRKFSLLLVVDVSGSMSNTGIVTTLAEVANICNVTKSDLDLIQIDTQAYPPEKYNKSQTQFTRKASGGTTLAPALKMAEQHHIDYQAIVVLTDGGLCDSDVQAFIDTGKRVIWLIEPTGDLMSSMDQGNSRAFKLKA